MQGKHILVLEDEPIIAFALEDQLLDEGAIVTVHCSLDNGLEAAKTEPFDFAILDVNLHGQRSYPLAYALTERSIPFAFATGYGDAEHPADLWHVPTLTKPYLIGHIRELVAAA